jgi:SAM-dependent methyltransferase
MFNINDDLAILVCPKCRGNLTLYETYLKCNKCDKSYPIQDGIIIFSSFREYERYGVKHQIYGIEKPLKPQTYYIDFIEKYRRFQPTDIVLDAGGGDMVWTAYLENRVRRIYNVDASIWQLLKARKRNKNAVLIYGDVSQLPFKNKSIDVIMEIYVFEHLKFEKALKAINEYYRVLRENGLLLMVTENPIGEYLWKKTIAKILHVNFGAPDPTHINMRFPRTIRKLLSENGFEMVRERIPIIGENLSYV